MEYKEKTGIAQCKLEWANAFVPREIVPKTQLYEDLSSGTNDPYMFPGLQVYASNGILQIKRGQTKSETLELTVHNLYGTIVMRENLNQSDHQFDLSRFAKGVYLIGIKSDKNNKIIKYIFE